MKKILLYWHTLRFLKPIQIYFQFKRLLFKKKCVSLKEPFLHLRETKRPFIQPILEPATFFKKNKICLLNQENIYSLALWNDSTPEKLWSYNLHYFDYLNAHAPKDRNHALQLVNDWIQYNPPFAGTGWEPYPLSLRIVNWIKFQLCEGALPFQALTSLYLQARFLYQNLEYHLLGNHLFANLKALIFAGLFFNTSESQQWLNLGLKLLQQELTEQILKDGGHFELSPMYHNIILEDLLDLMNLLQTYGRALTSAQINKINQMFQWSEKLCHPDGEISFFNDSSLNIAPNTADLLGYAQRLSFKPTLLPQTPYLYLQDSGLIRVHQPHFLMLIDVAEVGPAYLPGHAHADTLSFELSVKGQRLFVNPGCYSYQNLASRRDVRSTAAHNTVEVDGVDSSEMWGAFRVARRAHPRHIHIESSDENIHISAQHDGYLRLPGKVVHQRDFYITPQSLVIEDQLHGQNKSAIAYFHLPPSISVKIISATQLDLYLSDQEKVSLFSEQAIEIITAPYSDQFGVLGSHQALLIHFKKPRNKLMITGW